MTTTVSESSVASFQYTDTNENPVRGTVCQIQCMGVANLHAYNEAEYFFFAPRSWGKTMMTKLISMFFWAIVTVQHYISQLQEHISHHNKSNTCNNWYFTSGTVSSRELQGFIRAKRGPVCIFKNFDF
jgi:hypothetical protein